MIEVVKIGLLALTSAHHRPPQQRVEIQDRGYDDEDGKRRSHATSLRASALVARDASAVQLPAL